MCVWWKEILKKTHKGRSVEIHSETVIQDGSWQDGFGDRESLGADWMCRNEGSNGRCDGAGPNSWSYPWRAGCGSS